MEIECLNIRQHESYHVIKKLPTKKTPQIIPNLQIRRSLSDRLIHFPAFHFRSEDAKNYLQN